MSEKQRDIARSYLNHEFNCVKMEDSTNENLYKEPESLGSALPQKRSQFADLQDGEDQLNPNSFEFELQRYLNTPVLTSEQEGMQKTLKLK